MKQLIKKSKYIAVGIAMLLVLFSNSKTTSAVWSYTPVYDVPYVVVAGNASPTCNAGIDRSITLPTNSVTIPVGGATATDSDGTISSTVWTQVSGTGGSITNGTTLTPTFSSLSQGSYTYRLTATDNGSATCTDDMIVTVSAAGNIAPTANAGIDQSINLPTSSTSVSGSGSDSDGWIVSYAWTKISGGSATITSPSSASTSITGLAAGSYTFRLTVTDNGGLTGQDDMNITVNSAPTVTGSLTISPNVCTIAAGDSTCYVSGATWTTSNATSPQLVDGNTGSVLSTLANNAAPLPVWVAYTSTIFHLKNGTTILDSKTVTASCAGGSSWNGSICASSVVNGVCAANHFNCTAGTSTNNVTGASAWTWSCVGSGGGSTASCSENFPVGLPQCSDTIDNDGDGLVDYPNDPGCTSVSDTSEKNVKVREREI